MMLIKAFSTRDTGKAGVFSDCLYILLFNDNIENERKTLKTNGYFCIVDEHIFFTRGFHARLLHRHVIQVL